MDDNLYKRAHLLIEQRRYKEAGEILESLLTTQSNNPMVLSMFSQVCAELDDLPRALELINQAISLNPEEDFQFYIKARILLTTSKMDEAEDALNEAIKLNAEYADYYALLGHIKVLRKDIEEGLRMANQALSIEADNEMALNVRGRALLKTGRVEDSFATLEGALKSDPNNPYTHSNYGWMLLEKGDQKKALYHFREALKNAPNFEYAQRGMVEALKTRFFLYRWFLKYAFWMGNLSGKNQWVVIIGFYLGFRGLRILAERNENLAPFLNPLLIVLGIIAFSTWIIRPISNLFLRLNSFGKHLLTREEIKSSNFVGLSAIVAAIGLLLYLITKMDAYLSLVVFGISMFVPLSVLFQETKYKYIFPVYTIGLGVLGLLSVFASLATGQMINGISLIYILAFIAFQWLANFVMIKEDNP